MTTPYAPGPDGSNRPTKMISRAWANRRISTSNKVALGILVTIVLCVGGASITGAFLDDPKPNSLGATSGASEQIAATTTRDPTPAATVEESPRAAATTSKAKPRPTATHKATPKPRPRPSKTTNAPRKGVHPGAFCSPRGAYGTTSAGTLMQCKPSATDSRNRWRKA